MSLDDFLSLKEKNTRKAYLTALKHLEAYLDSSAKFCTREQAIRYFSEFRQGRADSTVRHRFDLLQHYFEYLQQTEEIPFNPFFVVKSLMSMTQQKQVRPTKTISPEDVQKILTSIDRSNADGRAVYALIALLFGAGLRREEARNIRVSDLNLAGSNPSLLLRKTKAGVRQSQPLPGWVVQALEAVICDNLADGKYSPTTPLFSWTESTAYRRVKDACRAARINAAPHAFRAAAATMLKEENEEDRTVAEFLRHKSTKMVQVYDHRRRKQEATANPHLENFMRRLKKFG